MGQQNSSQKEEKKAQVTPPNPDVVSSFKGIANENNLITYDRFKDKIGPLLAFYLWKYLMGDEASMSLEKFSESAKTLSTISPNVYVKILDSAEALLNASFEAASVTILPSDQSFIDSLKTESGDSFEEIVKWKNTVCPRICQAIQNKIYGVFHSKEVHFDIVKSDILSNVEMYILINCLPITVFFPQPKSHLEEGQSTQWTRLYSSHHQGISINRFDSNVFNYKGATLCIFKLSENRVFVIAADEEWKNSVNKYGGPHTMLFQMRPTFQPFDLPERPIYCNFKLRSGTLGLTLGRFFSVDGEMSNVSDIEVWGCGGITTLEEQQKLKLRQQLQAQRNGKVPLPGNWDENPDKSIMEMAGFQFSSERKNDRPDDY